MRPTGQTQSINMCNVHDHHLVRNTLIKTLFLLNAQHSIQRLRKTKCFSPTLCPSINPIYNSFQTLFLSSTHSKFERTFTLQVRTSYSNRSCPLCLASVHSWRVDDPTVLFAFTPEGSNRRFEKCTGEVGFAQA